MIPSVITIGLFDGVHLGHREIIKRVVGDARKRNARAVVVTFDRHPSDILYPGHGPLLLTDSKTKIALIKELGVDEVAVIPFTDILAALDPASFLDKYILPLNPLKIIVGSDFKFGKNKQGDVRFLEKYAGEHDFTVEAVSLLSVEGEKASSSAVRKHVVEGDIAEAKAILGRFPSVKGKVVKGDRRGHDIGFPTANVEIPGFMCLPLDGVYAGTVTVDGRLYMSVINIGLAPTFGRRDKALLEAYLFDFEGPLYGKDIEVEFIGRIRSERRFADAAGLASQITDDAQKALNMIKLTDIQKGG